MKKKKVLIFIITAAVMAILCGITVFADGEVANAVSNTWTKARGQIKSIVNDVVFPVIDVVLAILLFAKLATAFVWMFDFFINSAALFVVYSGNVIKEQV